MSILSRFLNVFRSKAVERDLEDELRFHLEERAASNRQRGMELPEAESAAYQQFGDVARVKSGMREIRMMNRNVIGAFALGLTIGVLAAAGVMWRVKPTPAVVALPAPAFYLSGQEGTSSPVLLREIKPNYSAEAMHAKIQGTVKMECIVQPEGMCDSVHVIKPLEPGLDREAITALLGWRFEPGKRQGKPVPVLVTIEMAFTLRS